MSLTLASELGIDLVAEGIETEQELQFLQSLNVSLGQGFLFSPPLPIGAFEDWIAAFDVKRQLPDLANPNASTDGNVVTLPRLAKP